MSGTLQDQTTSYSTTLNLSSRKTSGSASNQNERKRSKEAQWLSAIGQDDIRSSSAPHSSKDTSRKSRSSKQTNFADSLLFSSSSKTKSRDPSLRLRRVSDSAVMGRDRDAERSVPRPLSRIPEGKPSSSGRTKSLRHDASYKTEKHVKRNRQREDVAATSPASAGSSSSSMETLLPPPISSPPPTSLHHSVSSPLSPPLALPTLSSLPTLSTFPPRGTSPSLLSVASVSTGLTTRSNDSNATITQKSHDKMSSEVMAQNGSPVPKEIKVPVNVKLPEKSFETPEGSNIAGHSMKATVTDDDGDSEGDRDGTESILDTVSTSPSAASDLGSSEAAPETPSSRSTEPSPLSNRMPSQTTHWFSRADDDHDSVRAHSGWSDVGASHPPHSGQTFVGAREAHGDHDNDRELAERQARWNMERDAQSLEAREQALREHMAQLRYTQRLPSVVHHLPEPGVPGRDQPMAMPMYRQMKAIEHTTSPPQDQPRHPMPQHVLNPPVMPTAPEAPDLSRTTLAGYELLASKLAEDSSSIRPSYRKFEMMHHRILLHVQDELCELEEHLRRVDEFIAQMAPKQERDVMPPASRRADAFYGTELHRNRTQLLGQIFMKLEQYHRALSAYSDMSRSLDYPGEEDIARYREWMAVNRPVHQAEASFLRNSKDLVALPQRATGTVPTTTQPSMVLLAFIPFLPLVAFSLVPTFLGRIIISAAIAAAGWLYVSGTVWRSLLSDLHWAISIIVYLVLMSLIASVV